jgi:ankyrin repeat protein
MIADARAFYQWALEDPMLYGIVPWHGEARKVGQTSAYKEVTSEMPAPRIAAWSDIGRAVRTRRAAGDYDSFPPGLHPALKTDAGGAQHPKIPVLRALLIAAASLTVPLVLAGSLPPCLAAGLARSCASQPDYHNCSGYKPRYTPQGSYDVSTNEATPFYWKKTGKMYLMEAITFAIDEDPIDGYWGRAGLWHPEGFACMASDPKGQLATLASLGGKSVKLRVTMADAKMCSIQLACESNALKSDDDTSAATQMRISSNATGNTQTDGDLKSHRQKFRSEKSKETATLVDILALLVQATGPIYPGFGVSVSGYGSNLSTAEYEAIRDTEIIPDLEDRLQVVGIDAVMEGDTLLTLCTRMGEVEAAQFLIDHGATVDMQPSLKSALDLAASSGHVGMADMLLRAGANPNQRSKLNGMTPLMLASMMAPAAKAIPTPTAVLTFFYNNVQKSDETPWKVEKPDGTPWPISHRISDIIQVQRQKDGNISFFPWGSMWFEKWCRRIATKFGTNPITAYKESERGFVGHRGSCWRYSNSFQLRPADATPALFDSPPLNFRSFLNGLGLGKHHDAMVEMKMHGQRDPVTINATKLERMIRTIPGLSDNREQQLLFDALFYALPRGMTKAPVQVSHTELARVLLEHGADVNLRNEASDSTAVAETALGLALTGEANPLTQLLIDSGADVNALFSLMGRGRMHLLSAEARKDTTEGLRALLEAGATVDIRDNGREHGGEESSLLEGTTPLMLAAQEGTHLAAEALVDHGADVNAADSYGISVLMHACMHASVDAQLLVQLLLRSGADVTALARGGQFALQIAAQHGNAAVVGELLNNTRAITMINQADLDGRTALIAAMDEETISGEPVDAADVKETLQVLLAYGADDLPLRHDIKASSRRNHYMTEEQLTRAEEVKESDLEQGGFFDRLDALMDGVVAEEEEVARRAKSEEPSPEKQHGRRARLQRSEF